MPGASGCPLSLSASSGGCMSARPSTRSMSARGRPPGRSSIGWSKMPTMVDSTPTATAPPSTIRSIRPSRSLCTWAAMVGDTWPDRLADGATTGRPKTRRMSRATGCAGIRIATVSRPGGGEIGHRAVGAFWAAPASAGPARTPRPAAVRPRQNGRFGARRRGRRHGRSAD